MLDFLTFGFPLDFNRNSPSNWEGDSHKSALDHPDDIEAYLQEEIDFKAIVGPFAKHPCETGHILPFMTRDKPGSKHRRVIIDLSWPIGCSDNGHLYKIDISRAFRHINDPLHYDLLGLHCNDVYVDTYIPFEWS